MANKFHFPASSYYSKSNDLKSKVDIFIEDMQTNIIDIVNNDSEVEASDMTFVKGATGYVTGTQLITKFEGTYLKKLTEMSSENGSNPMNQVVETDTKYSAQFQSILDGTNQSELMRYEVLLDARILTEQLKAPLDDDLVKSLLKIGVVAKNMGDINKVLRNVTDEGKVGQILELLAKDEKAMALLAKSKETWQIFAQNSVIVKYLGSSKAASFVKSANNAFQNLTKYIKNGSKVGNYISDLFKGDTGKLLVSVLGEAGSKVMKVIKHAGIALEVVNLSVKVAKNFNENKKDFRDGKVVRGTIKTAAGAVIDRVAEFDALDGMVYGAMLGSAVPFIGTGIGAAVGGVIGSINQVYQVFNPNLWKDFKKNTNKGIDFLADGANKIVDNVGKGVSEGISKVKNFFSTKVFAW